MKSFLTTSGLAMASVTEARGNMLDGTFPIYKNVSYSAQDRAADLLSRMAWVDKIGQMGGVRRLLGTNLSFDQASYNIVAEYQNGILGKF